MLEEIKADLKKLDDAAIVDLTKAIAELKKAEVAVEVDGDAWWNRSPKKYSLEAKKLASWPAKVWTWWENYGWLVATIETGAFIVWVVIRH